MKKLLILGASGSIGQQTIDLLINNRITYDFVGFSVGKNVEYIDIALSKFKSVKFVYLIDDEKKEIFSKKYADLHFFSEKDGFEAFIKAVNPDVVVNALVGFAGVIPTLETIKLGKDLMLANKESLVVAGDLVNELLKTSSTKLIPIDSEHVAIDKCLQHVEKSMVQKIILTCSGGPFRDKTKEELMGVKVEDALKHPTWKMGNKITIDSATLINKVFEIIEAHYLFDYDFEHIEVMIHPESKVHSMIELKNEQMLLDYGPNDMRIPIEYALSYRKNIDLNMDEFVKNAAELHFFSPNEFQNDVLSIAKTVIEQKGTMGCILNAANDFLVEKFLNKEISFLDIYKYIHLAMQNITCTKKYNVQDIISTNNIVKYYLQTKIEEDKQ